MLFLLIWFFISHSLGFGYVKLCCSLPLVLCRVGGKNLNIRSTADSVCLAWLLEWFGLKGGREQLECNYQTLATFVGFFSSTREL